jgi:excisionase family DNA binding protein
MPASVYNIAMYSVKQAAEELGLDTSQVRRLLAKGEIKGVKLARDWVVLDLSYRRKRKPRKR